MWQALSKGQGERRLFRVGRWTVSGYGSCTAKEAVSISQASLGSLPLTMREEDSHWSSNSSSDTVEVGG